jgi:hypothetical protein
VSITKKTIYRESQEYTYDPKYDDAKPTSSNLIESKATADYYHFLAFWDKNMYNGEKKLK